MTTLGQAIVISCQRGEPNKKFQIQVFNLEALSMYLVLMKIICIFKKAIVSRLVIIFYLTTNKSKANTGFKYW